MPSSMIRVAADPHELAAAVRMLGTDFTVTRSGTFAAEVTRIDLHTVWMQRGQESLPRIMQYDQTPLRFGFVFFGGPDTHITINGITPSITDLVLQPGGLSYSHVSDGPAEWGSLSLPMAEAQELCGLLACHDLKRAPSGPTVIAAPIALARLQRVHAAATRLAETAPEVIANPEAARGLEQTLIHALVGCLQETERDQWRPYRHAIILRRFRHALEDEPDRPLYIPELCAAIGVAERTLRACCQEHLGMSPKRYLLLRRLHLAHRALRDSVPNGTNVTEIATRYGFWELGRFAVAYKVLFGESPSTTLRRA